jgi:hypothetical protein
MRRFQSARKQKNNFGMNAMKPVQENIEITREDGGTFTFKPVKGDYTGRLNYVTFKEDFDPVTDDRLIEKSSAAGQVRCTYNAAKKESTFEFDYLPVDTRDLAQTQLVYDITSISSTDSTDVKTPKKGYCNIIGDVRNDLNGLDLPDTAERLLPIFASNFEDGQYIRVGENVNGVKEFKGSYDVFGMLAIDTDGNLTIDDHIMLDNNLMIDVDGDITFKD